MEKKFPTILGKLEKEENFKEKKEKEEKMQK